MLALVLLSAWAHAQWTQAYGPPSGGTVNALAVSYARIYAGSYGGGVYYSDNFGGLWVRNNAGLENLRIRRLAVHENTVFAGVEGGGAYTSPKVGIPYWRKIEATGEMTVSAFAFDREAVYIGTFGDGILVSTDNGKHWYRTNVGLKDLNILDLTVFGHNLFAATDDGIFISENHGDTWHPFSKGLLNTDVHTLAVHKDHLYAGTAGGGVFQLGMDDMIWSPVNTGLQDRSVQSLTAYDAKMFAGTPTGVYMLADGADTWTDMSDGLAGIDVFALAVCGTRIMAGTLGHGVYMTFNDGTIWKAVNEGMMNSSVSALHVEADHILAGTTREGLFLSEDEGETWTAVGPKHIGVTDIVPMDAALFAAAEVAGVLRSLDHGKHWLPVNNGLPPVSVTHLEVNGNYLLAGTPNGVFRSLDLGDTWQYASNGMGNFQIRSLVSYGRRILAGTPDGVYCSINGGDYWRRVSMDIDPMDVQSMVMTKTSIYVTTSGQILLSRDEGQTWDDITGELYPHIGLLASDASHILAVHCDQRKFLLGIEEGPVPAEHAEPGIYMTTDKGDSWRKANGDLTNTFVCTALIRNDKVYIGTDGGGVFINDLIIPDKGVALTSDAQIWLYPNPVTERATIEDLGIVDKARVSVYSTSGQLLLAEETSHQVPSIHVASLTPGIYILRYENGATVATRMFVKE